jgi:hypothetical protein
LVREALYERVPECDNGSEVEPDKEDVARVMAVSVIVIPDAVASSLNDADGVATLWLIVKLCDAVWYETVLLMLVWLWDPEMAAEKDSFDVDKVNVSLRDFVRALEAVRFDLDEVEETSWLGDWVSVSVLSTARVCVASCVGVGDPVSGLAVSWPLLDADGVNEPLLTVPLYDAVPNERVLALVTVPLKDAVFLLDTLRSETVSLIESLAEAVGSHVSDKVPYTEGDAVRFLADFDGLNECSEEKDSAVALKFAELDPDTVQDDSLDGDLNDCDGVPDANGNVELIENDRECRSWEALNVAEWSDGECCSLGLSLGDASNDAV